VDLIVDAAYIDFAPDELREAMISALKSLPEETLCYLCFLFLKDPFVLWLENRGFIALLQEQRTFGESR
jgi:hypothetical protein